MVFLPNSHHHEYNHEKHVRQVQTEENPKIPDQLSLNIIKSSKTKKEAATAKSSLKELQQKKQTGVLKEIL